MRSVFKPSIPPFVAIKRAYDSFDAHDGSLLAGGIAFFAMLSVAPVLVIAFGLASVVFGTRGFERVLVEELTPFVGEQPAQLLGDLVERSSEPQVGSIAALAGTVVMLYAATRVFVEIQNALYRVWGIARHEPERIRAKAAQFFYRRALAFVLVLVLGLLLGALTVAQATLQWFAGRIGMDDFSRLIFLGDLVIAYLALTGLVASIYRLLAGGVLGWRSALRGGAATALLLTLGGGLIGVYLRLGFAYSVYGAAGSLAALLLGAYYAATIFLFGAELARVYREFD